MMMLMSGRKGAEEATGFAVGAGGEEERAVVGTAGAESQAPEALDDDGLAVGALHEADEVASAGAEGGNFSVAEVADQYVAAEDAERSRRLGDGPRGVERAARSQSLHQIASGGIDVDKPIADAGDVVVGV